MPEEAGDQLAESLPILRLPRVAEIDPLDLREKRRHRHVHQRDEMEPPLLQPPPPRAEERSPLVAHPWRGERLGSGNQDEVLAPINPRLELSHPGAPASQVRLVEKHLPRPAGRGETLLQVCLERAYPRRVAVRIADERGVAVVRRRGLGARRGDFFVPLCGFSAHRVASPSPSHEFEVVRLPVRLHFQHLHSASKFSVEGRDRVGAHLAARRHDQGIGEGGDRSGP